MSLILGALGGFGEGMANVGAQMQKEAFQRDRDEENRKYETEKMKLAEELRTNSAIAGEKRAEETAIRTEQRKAAPLNRVGEAARAIVGTEAPMQPSDVQNVEGGKGNAFDGKPLTGSGLQGDSSLIMSAIKSLPDGEDKTNALKQFESQKSAEAAGKTKTVSNDEALSMALNKLKVSDPEAYAAYQQSIGKSDREDKRLDQGQQRIDNRDDWERQRAARLDTLAEAKTAYDKARADRQDGKIDSQMEREELRSQRTSVTELMKSTEKELERNMTLAGNDPTNAELYKRRAASLTNDLTKYRKALETFSGGSVPEEKGNGLDPELASRIAELSKSKAPASSAKADSPSAPTKVEAPAYIPPAGSPAAKALENRSRAADARNFAKQGDDDMEAVQRSIASDAAKQALFSMDAKKAMQVQQMPGFSLLDAATKAEIFKVVNGK